MTKKIGKNYSVGEIEYTVIELLGVLDEQANGWRREVNIVDWNGNGPRVDIRSWNQEYTRMSRGITLREDEGRDLAKILQEYYISKDVIQKIPNKEDIER